MGSPSAEAQAGAARLASEASRAMILGEPPRAYDLLVAALEQDPSSVSNRLQLARVLEEMGEPANAISELCRTLALDPSPDVRAEAVRRLDRLAGSGDVPVGDVALAALDEGIVRYESGDVQGAIQAFSRALAEEPDWDRAYFNRGVAYLQAGWEGAGRSDLRRYLELNPRSEDAALVRAHLEGPASRSRGPSPVTALAVGALLPGMGHFYAGRPGMGTFFLLGAGASAAAGLLYQEVEVDCLAQPGPEGCPPGQVLDRRESRPFLTAGVAGAVGLTLFGAVHAFLTTRGPDRTASGAPEGTPLRVEVGAASISLEPALVGGGPGTRALVRVEF